MKHILAVDQGTTGSRAILFEEAGREVASAYEPVRQMYPRPGWVEHDPEDIWRGVVRCIERVLSETQPAEGLEPSRFHPRISPDQARSMRAGWNEVVARTIG